MFERMQYRLWKHLDKRFGSGTTEGGGNLAALRRDIEDLRTILLAQVCAPGLVDGVGKFRIPTGERGSFFNDYLRQNVSSHDRVQTLIAKEKLALAEALASYQSDVVSVEEIEAAFSDVVDTYPEVALQARASWLHFLCDRADVTGSLETLCDAVMRDPGRDRSLDPYVWGKAICAYFYLGKVEKAREAMREFHQAHGLCGVPFCPALSRVAVDAGLIDPNVASSVFDDVVRLTKERRFEKEVAGKRVALVGSGPQLRGSGRGKEIDAYDFVMRVNHYNLSDKLAVDYGRKVNAWGRAVDLEDEYKDREKGSPAYSLLTFSLFISPYSMDRLNLFRRQLDEGHVIQALTADAYRDIIRQTGLHNPSGGARFACYLKSLVPGFSIKDCYAFSFLENEVKPWYRADGTLLKTPRHNLAAEQKPMQNILSSCKE